MQTGRTFLITMAVMLFVIFLISMAAIVAEYNGISTAGLFFGGLASGFSGVALIPIIEIKTEYTPPWFYP